jgi:hypothetical protein
MVAEMPDVLRCGFIDQPLLVEGRWLGPLTGLLGQAPPREPPRTDGAHVAARMIAERLGR